MNDIKVLAAIIYLICEENLKEMHAIKSFVLDKKFKERYVKRIKKEWKNIGFRRLLEKELLTYNSIFKVITFRYYIEVYAHTDKVGEDKQFVFFGKFMEEDYE